MNGIYLNELVEIIGESRIRYGDGFEEDVDMSDVQIFPKQMKRSPIKPNPKRKKKRFGQTFGSPERAKKISAMPCLVCGKRPSVNAHVKTRGSGGTYKDIIPLCFSCHNEQEGANDAFEKKYEIDLYAEAKRISEILDNPS